MQFFIDGKKVRYNPTNMKKDEYLNSGLEIDAYLVNNGVVKFFKEHPGKEIYLTKEAIERMKKIKTNRIYLPKNALLDKKHNLRAYTMDYIENLGKDTYFNLEKDKLQEENELLKDDIKTLSDNKLQLEDLNHKNTSYNNGIYLIDPGSYAFVDDLDSNQVYRINIDLINKYLIYEIINNYHLIKYSKLDYASSYYFSKQLNEEYNKSGKDNVLDFFSDIEEENLAEFIEKRVAGKKH